MQPFWFMYHLFKGISSDEFKQLRTLKIEQLALLLDSLYISNQIADSQNFTTQTTYNILGEVQ